MMVPSAMVKIRRLTKKTRYFTHGTAGFGSSSEKEHKMRILGIQLLILLCQSTLILCDSTTLVMNCTAQSNALENCGTDPCTWNISKKSFNILEYKCTDKDNKEVCSSLEECKLKNDHFTKFVKNMLSKIDCEHIQDNIECSSKLIKEKYDCNNQCLKGNYVCKFTISLAESVPVDGTFPVNGDFHCTVTNASKWSKISRIKGFDDTKEGFSDPIERNVNFEHGRKKSSIGLRNGEYEGR
ncbi:uncharacterized protein LOC130241360 [Danio aesculapii]|uniref:uncharacterized protein LOC130241360 n=1 Tax=Danio aesculapii TaxID=1142201 RepID=UPI0024BFCF27|nr:uncharacterized protein LOC130241360 [Danio aesculapii]